MRLRFGTTVAFFSEFDGKDGRDCSDPVSGFHLYRHNPGRGSWPMAFAFHNSVHDDVLDVVWNHRVGLAKIIVASSAHRTSTLHVIGLHGSHTDLENTLEDVAAFLSRAKANDHIIITGDWNKDILMPPGSAASDVNFSSLIPLLNARGLNIVYPEPSKIPCGGPFANVSMIQSISRVQRGINAAAVRPKLLDYSAVSQGILIGSHLDWFAAHHDHAFCNTELMVVGRTTGFASPVWHCRNFLEAVAWVTGNASASFLTADIFLSFVQTMMCANADERNRRHRRESGTHPDLKALYYRLANTSDVSTRRHLHKQAVLLKHHWYYQQRQEAFSGDVRAGKATHSCPKLFPIRAIYQTPVTFGSGNCHQRVPSYNKTVWEQEVRHEFETRWRCGDLNRLSLLLDIRARYARDAFKVDAFAVLRALDKMKPSKRVDSSGVCTVALRVAAISRPDLVADAVNEVLASDTDLSSFEVRGSLKGKKSPTTWPADIRAILPLPALLEVADYVVAEALNGFLNESYQPPAGCYFGAVKGSQCADIATALQLCIEKGLDRNAKAAIADMDVANYYDSICPIVLADWALRNSVPAPLIGSMIRLVTCPRSVLTIGALRIELRPRTLGVFTGSRLAGAIGRIPLLDAAHSCITTIQPLGFPAGGQRLCFTSWVDNITAVSETAHGAIRILETLSTHLRQHWSLAIKPASRKYLSAHPNDSVGSETWKRERTIDLLGYVLTDNCCPLAPFKQASTTVWKAFYAKLSHEGYRSLAPALIAVQLDRFLLPILRAKWLTWPFGKCLAGKLDTLQNRLLSSVMAIPMIADEDVARYVRRRCHLASSHSAAQGSWSLRWAADLNNWYDHCKRNSCARLWHGHLHKEVTPSFLMQQRSLFCINSTRWSVQAGRTATRHAAGKVQTRYLDSIGEALEYMLERGTRRTLKLLKRNRQ